jgi:hypothetical protein
MHRPAPSFRPVPRDGAPRWLVFVALVYCATLLGPIHVQLLVASALPGFDSRSSVVASDRSPSLQTTDRRQATSADDGNPPQLATGPRATLLIGFSRTQPANRFFDAPAAQQPRSQAQPRAPPADARLDL